MTLLLIDGNSIINRAYYGVKLLSTKDGRFTNAVYGFMNIFLNLLDNVKPDAVAVAFDVKQPTFRHELFSEYKAGRKGTPPELVQQMPVVKELLELLGYKTIECPGYEADDIIGTLSVAGADKCFIATGDRDSLQLVSDTCSVLLASTKAGKPVTIEYDKAKLFEDYSLSPKTMIELKALMGDSSDNIPGVAGIGQKTATDLLLKYNDIDTIFSDIDALAASDSVKRKLHAGRESAFLSRTLGTINKNAPIDTQLKHYQRGEIKASEVIELLAELEMFKIIERLNLSSQAKSPSIEQEGITCYRNRPIDELREYILTNKKAYFSLDKGSNGLTACFEYRHGVFVIENQDAELIAFLVELLSCEDVGIYTSSSKLLFSIAHSRGLINCRLEFDPILAAYLLNPNASDYNLLNLCREYSVAVGVFDDNQDEELASVASMSRLCAVLEDYLAENNQMRLLSEIELPLAETLASMEDFGFAVDIEGIKQFSQKLSDGIDRLTLEIFNEAGREFNINSPKQLGEVLFVDMGIPPKKKTKTGYSTNAEVLEELSEDYPIVSKILEYRSLCKLKSTYCDGLLKVVGEDGRIHSTFNQTETRTGRISSSEPNLQNIPIRQELGRELRKYFKAADGYILSDADYSQIELRVLAHIANDAAMLEAFNQGVDIHTVTASQVFNMPISMVTPLMRSRAKAVNFGIVYGIGAFSLAKDIHVSRAEADRYIKSYLQHYSAVDAYMKSTIEKAKQDGYVETIFHRRRMLPELSSSNGIQRAFGERVARNMPIQGSAADIIKIAMINVFRRLAAEGLSSRLILQVHDELIVETKLDEREAVAKILSEEMENAAQLKVRLVADVHSGETWYDAKS